MGFLLALAAIGDAVTWARFCLVAGALEFSMNAVVVATFQPIVVELFGWSANDIACVRLGGEAGTGF